MLLSSVFGPYARDDEFGSRSINPMELYHNQVTRAQGPFSLRMFHRSWGIIMIQANISAPCAVLDFPTRDRFAEELRTGRYDIVGISSIIVNVGKVREMCRMVRDLSPASEIVVGGHVTAIPGIERLIDADHIVRGEGISWMRRHLGEDDTAPLRHPAIPSGFGRRVLGFPLPDRPGSTAATIIPSLGCPMGCNFCTTSSFFGGKGKHIDLFTGDELYEVIRESGTALGVGSFFVMDENFLLDKPRALGLLRRIKQENKSWEFYVFSSANAIRKYSMAELIDLGVSWIWMGLESPRAGYAKLNGAETVRLTRELREHGIRVLGSTIVGLEHHTPQNILSEIEHAVRHDTDFHQFMLYTPVPGTPLYEEVAGEGRLLEDVDFADIHGQFQFNFRHAAISREDSKKFLDYAFLRDFQRNGPSLYRICRTTFEGWKRFRDHADERIRARFEREARAMRTLYTGALWAMERKLRNTNAAISESIRALRLEIERALGPISSLSSGIVGPALLWSAWREERRLLRGHTYEPPTFLERMNWPVTDP